MDRRVGSEQVSDQAGKWIVLAIVAVGQFMGTLDSSIVNISLPSIARYFGVPLGGRVESVIIGYLIVVAALLLTCGRLADIVGRRPVWMIGLALFTLGSACCGLAPSLDTLIVARLIQGIGAAFLLSVPGAMLASAFPPRELGRAMGWNTVAVGVGITAGPTVGGLITQHLLWRWIFFINVPVGILALVATFHFLRPAQQRQRARLDLAGAFLLAVGMAGLTVGLSYGQQWGWSSPSSLGLIGAGLVALLMIVPVERRVRAPIIDPRLLRIRPFVLASTCQFLSFLTITAVSFLMPFYFLQLRGFSPEKAGLLLTPVPVLMALIAPQAGKVADRFGSRWVSTAGMAMLALALLTLSFCSAETPLWFILAGMVADGVGQGLFYSANNRRIMNSAPASQRGVASGILASGKFVGQGLAVASAGAIFATLGGGAAGRLLVTAGRSLSADDVARLQATFVHAFHPAMLAACGAGLVSMVLAALASDTEPAAQSVSIEAGAPVAAG